MDKLEKISEGAKLRRSRYWNGNRYMHRAERKTRKVVCVVFTILVLLGLSCLAYSTYNHWEYISYTTMGLTALLAFQIVFGGYFIYRSIVD